MRRAKIATELHEMHKKGMSLFVIARIPPWRETRQSRTFARIATAADGSLAMTGHDPKAWDLFSRPSLYT
jgi:hypothetical protein